MTEEGFIRAIVGSPSEEMPRQVYADWLDDLAGHLSHSPHHSCALSAGECGPKHAAYLRAELTWARTGNANARKRLKTAAKALDPEWVARVSRPPVGVCFSCRRFTPGARGTTPAEVGALEKEFAVRLPPEYRGFLLNYNGGGFSPPVEGEDGEPDRSCFVEWFCGINPQIEDYPVLDLAPFARELREGSGGVYEEAGLLPFGAPENERMVYLLGTAGDRAGQVVLHDDMIDPWDAPEEWTVVAPSLPAFLHKLLRRYGD